MILEVPSMVGCPFKSPQDGPDTSVKFLVLALGEKRF